MTVSPCFFRQTGEVVQCVVRAGGWNIGSLRRESEAGRNDRKCTKQEKTCSLVPVYFFRDPKFFFRKTPVFSGLRERVKKKRKNGCSKMRSGYYPSPCSRNIRRIWGDWNGQRVAGRRRGHDL
jgi:hypothetical protein